MLAKLTDRIIHVQLYGNITSKTYQLVVTCLLTSLLCRVDRLAQALRYKSLYNVHLIAVSVSASSGKAK